MTPAAIIREAAADGMRLALAPAGTIKATGNQAAVNRWLPVLRYTSPTSWRRSRTPIYRACPPSSRPACPPRTWATSWPATFRWGLSRRRPPSPGRPRASRSSSRSRPASSNTMRDCLVPRPRLEAARMTATSRGSADLWPSLRAALAEYPPCGSSATGPARWTSTADAPPAGLDTGGGAR